MRIIVTGGRHANSDPARELVWRTLDKLTEGYAPQALVIVQGDCHLGGADKQAKEWALARGVHVESYPASNFGSWPDCGPRRNRHMVSLGADLCVGFPEPGSKGTWGCLKEAVDAGIPVYVHALWTRVVRK